VASIGFGFSTYFSIGKCKKSLYILVMSFKVNADQSLIQTE